MEESDSTENESFFGFGGISVLGWRCTTVPSIEGVSVIAVVCRERRCYSGKRFMVILDAAEVDPVGAKCCIHASMGINIETQVNYKISGVISRRYPPMPS